MSSVVHREGMGEPQEERMGPVADLLLMERPVCGTSLSSQSVGSTWTSYLDVQLLGKSGSILQYPQICESDDLFQWVYSKARYDRCPTNISARCNQI